MSKLTKRKNIDIDLDIQQWKEREHPGLSWWWLINALLRNFMELHKVEGRTATMVRKAARNTLKEL